MVNEFADYEDFDFIQNDYAALDSDRKIRRLQQDLQQYKRKYSIAVEENARLNDELAAMINYPSKVGEDHGVPLPEVCPMNAAMPIVLLSDWHVGARVEGETVEFLNEFTPGIAAERSQKLFQNIHQKINTLRQEHTIDELVLAVLGDMIEGWIHEDQVETNYLAPCPEVLFVEELLEDGIKFLLANSDLKTVYIPCCFGNHGRTTAKFRSGNAADTSYEWLMYNNLAKTFREEPRVKFKISRSHIHYWNIWGKELRFHHGDGIKYMGGGDGLMVSANNWIRRTNDVKRADMSFVGHHHTVVFGENITVNGSLVGIMPYGYKASFKPSAPCQVMRVLEADRGFTSAFPIFCD
jgi:hypothetical protein